MPNRPTLKTIGQAAGLSQEQFLERGFRMLYRSIARKTEVTA